MPQTPFIGLSLIIHLFIIMINKLFSWFPKRKEGKQSSILLTKIKSISIIIIIFSFVTFQAIILLRVSIIDKHSSLKYISKYVTEINEFIINKNLKSLPS
jgi:hypothetical protein